MTKFVRKGLPFSVTNQQSIVIRDTDEPIGTLTLHKPKFGWEGGHQTYAFSPNETGKALGLVPSQERTIKQTLAEAGIQRSTT